jgi:Pilus formation protein N terminal region
MTASCVGGRAPSLLRWLLGALVLIAVAAPAAAVEPIVVELDQARVMKLPDRAATVVIGNPLIADISLQHSGIGVITGKGYGATNVVVLDRTGTVLLERTIEVTWPSDPIVVVYRGASRETYSCTPDCSRRIMLGDFPEYFDKTLSQITTRDSQAAGMAAGSTPH